MENLFLSPWVIWASLSLIFFILEIFIPGFWIATFGVGALATSIVSAFSDSLNVQLAVFALSSATTFIFLRPVIVKFLYKSADNIETNIGALIGRRVIVIETIDNVRSIGRVKIGGEFWRARNIDDTVIEQDETVEILKVDGAKVIVKHYNGE